MEIEEQTTALSLPDRTTLITSIKAVNEFQKVVHQLLIEGADWGVIPGTQKPTLLKPGAEKITKLLGLADHYEIVAKQEDWEKPFFRYVMRADLVHINTGVIISQGFGECNSMESKYRWRESKRKCPNCGAEAIIQGKPEYGGGWLCFKKQGGCGAKFPLGDPKIESQKIGRVENEDIYSQVNTILKMAKKRALVDAALSAGRLSNIFTQDMEDMPLADKETGEIIEATAKVASVEPNPVPAASTDPVMAQLKKDLDALGWTGVVSWLRARFNASGTKVSEIMKLLTPEQQQEFLAEVKSRREMQGE